MNKDYSEGWETAYSQHSVSGLWSDEAIPCVADVIRELQAADVSVVLDVGCGDGRNLEKLIESGFRATGVDISDTALARAVSRLNGQALLVKGSVLDLAAFPDASVEAITCLDVFGQIEDTSQMIETFRRVLRPQGILALNAFTPDDSEYGVGTRLDKDTFEYKGTLFKFFDERSIRDLFDGWEMRYIDRQSWTDAPHGEFRPYEHSHDNWVIVATPTPST